MKKIILSFSLFALLFLVACKKTEPFNVTLETNGGTPIEVISSFEDLQKGIPATEKVGYVFDGWFFDDAFTIPYDIGNVSGKPIILYAKWKPGDTTYLVEYYQEKLDGSYELTDSVSFIAKVEDTIQLTNINPPTGFFQSTKTEQILTGIIPASGQLVLKVYFDRNLYTISFDTDGGEEIDPLILKYGQPIVLPSPSKQDYRFTGWDQEVPETMPAIALVLKALFELIPTSKIEFYVDATLFATEIVQENKALDNPPTAPQKIGYVFENWYDSENNELVVFPHTPTKDISVYAKWTPILVDYQINVYLEQLNGEFIKQNVITKQALTDSNMTIVPDEYTGFSFSSNHTSNIISNVIQADGTTVFVTYYTRNFYQINFESNVSLSIQSIHAKYEESIAEPLAPVRIGYDFVGWYLESSFDHLYSFTTMPANILTLYAKWQRQEATLSFDSRGGSDVAPIKTLIDNVINKPNDPMKDGYDFAGWYYEVNLVTAFTNWTMPYGNITLYAKWEEKAYQVTFDTNEGSLVPPISVKHSYLIPVPESPTKENYIFDGWFADALCTNPFSFAVMPMQDVVVYAKWIDETSTASIKYKTSLDRYTEITITGTVYAILDGNTKGFYVYDSTGNILVYDDALVQLGDKVNLTGILYQQDVVATLRNITNIEIVSNNQALPIFAQILISKLNGLEQSYDFFGDVFLVEGVLMQEREEYYLFNPKTYEKIKVSNLFQNTNLPALENQKLNANIILTSYQEGWYCGIISYTSSNYEEQERFTDIAHWITTMYQDKTFFAFETVVFPITDPCEKSVINVTINSGYEQFYDANQLCFLEVNENTVIKATAFITLGSQTTSITLDLMVGPTPVVSILDLKSSIDNNAKAIEGVVIFSEQDGSLFGVYDGTQTIYIESNENIEIGDKVRVVVNKRMMNLVGFIHEEEVIFIKVLSKENPITYPTNVMTAEAFLALSKTDPNTFGQKVQIRGFVLENEEQGYFFVEINENMVPIIPISYSGFETLMEFQDIEVDIKGYVTLVDGSLALFFEGIREDIQIPDYTPLERVEMIFELFSREYSDYVFTSLEEFMLWPYHPLLGGNITYTFLEGEQYYDYEWHRFKSVTAEVVIKLQITITKDDITNNYIFQTTLKPFQTTKITELNQLNKYEPVYVQGIIVYRNPNLAYLQDDTGMVLIDVYDLDCYEGDEVIIKGYLNKPYYQDEQLSLYRENYENVVVSLISRQNPILIPTLEGFDVLRNLSSHSYNTFNQRIALTGILDVDYNGATISDGFTKVTIEAADGYTKGKLDRVDGLKVTIKGVLTSFDEQFVLYFVGLHDDLMVHEYTDSEKLNYLEGWISGFGGVEVIGGAYYTLPSQDENFGAVIAYEMNPNDAAYYNLDTFQTAAVSTKVEITITATITLNETNVKSVPITLAILPEKIIPLVLISELFTLPIDSYKLQGKILAVMPYRDAYAFLVQDSSGKILVPTKATDYYYDSRVCGKTITVVGHLGYDNGRPEVMNANYTIGSYSTSIDTTFENTLIRDVISYNLYDRNVYGKPLLITGRISLGSDYQYIVSDGEFALKIQAVSQTNYNLSYYAGLEMTMKVFFLGDTDDDGVMEVSLNNAYYGGNSALIFGNYSDEELATIVFHNAIKNMEYDTFLPYQEVELVSSFYILPQAQITHTLLSSSEVASINGSYLYFKAPSIDQVVEVLMTVVYNNVTISQVLTFAVSGVDIKSYEDLFTLYPELDEMSVYGQMLYQGWGYVYLLIEGNVYYLEGFFDCYCEYGEKVLITGKKSTIDGSTNYTYDISILATHEYLEVVYYTRATPIEELDLLHMDPQLLKSILLIYGILRYDEYLGWYYIEPKDPTYTTRIYIRAEVSEYGPQSLGVFGYGNGINKYEFDQYLGLYVGFEVLNPGLEILDQYVVVDFVPPLSVLQLSDMTPEERIALGIEQLDALEPSLTFDSGENIYDKLPYGHEALDLIYEYSLFNENDQTIVDISYGEIGNVSVATIITLQVIIKYYEESNGMTYQEEHFIDIVVHPLVLSTIYEILMGKPEANYLVEGQIVMIYQDEFMIISDGTLNLYVETYMLSEEFNITLAVGDYVRILGKRYFHDYGSFIPVLGNLRSIEKIEKDPINLPAIGTMGLTDILNLNYCIPTNFMKRVSITGTLYKIGPYYPVFLIHFDGELESHYDVEIISNMSESDFDLEMTPHFLKQITVTGYLAFIEDIYLPFNWIFIVDSYVVVE